MTDRGESHPHTPIKDASMGVLGTTRPSGMPASFVYSALTDAGRMPKPAAAPIPQASKSRNHEEHDG